MDVKGLQQLLKNRVDMGMGGDEVVIQDIETGSVYSVDNVEFNEDTEQFILYAEME